MFRQGPHLASKGIYKIRKMHGDISIFAFDMATVISFCHAVIMHVIFYTLGHQPARLVCVCIQM